MQVVYPLQQLVRLLNEVSLFAIPNAVGLVLTVKPCSLGCSIVSCDGMPGNVRRESHILVEATDRIYQ